MIILSTSGHCGLVTPYGDIDLGQHWFRYWLVAWWHRTVAWTTVALSSVRCSSDHVRAISQEILLPSVAKIRMETTYLKFISNLPGVKELSHEMVGGHGDQSVVPGVICWMKTSSNGNISRVTGPLCRVFTGHRWIPLTKASDTELCWFLWFAPELTVE